MNGECARSCDTCPFVQSQLADKDLAQAAIRKMQALAGGVRSFLEQDDSAINTDIEVLGTVDQAIDFHSDPAMYSDEWVRQVPEDVTKTYYEKLALADLQVTTAVSNIETAQATCQGALVTPAEMQGYIVMQCTSTAELASGAISVRPEEA